MRIAPTASAMKIWLFSSGTEPAFSIGSTASSPCSSLPS